jgi:hypothetical protein
MRLMLKVAVNGEPGRWVLSVRRGLPNELWYDCTIHIRRESDNLVGIQRNVVTSYGCVHVW